MKYVTSDLHGEYDLFLSLLEKINFSDEDVLYICGDVIEKGDDSLKLAKLISQMPNARCVLGNHEYAFLKYYWKIMQGAPSDAGGALKKLRDYFSDDGSLLDWQLVDWFESLPFYIEEEDFICVHAGVPLDREARILPLEDAIPEQLVNDRAFKEPSVIVKDGKCVFFGHTPTSYVVGGDDKILAYLRPERQGNGVSDYYKIHLDLGTWVSGKLGCFCIETCKCFYVERSTRE